MWAYLRTECFNVILGQPVLSVAGNKLQVQPFACLLLRGCLCGPVLGLVSRLLLSVAAAGSVPWVVDKC